MRRKLIDLTNKKFGRWTVIKKAGYNKWRDSLWLCRCDCGIEKIIQKRCLKSGGSKSCGCLKKEFWQSRKRLSPGLATMRQSINIYKGHARRRGLGWNLTEKQFAEITQKDCYYCGAKPNNIMKNISSNGDYIYNGIDRVDNSKGYTIDNIVPCCRKCNRAKDTSSIREYKNWIKKSYHKIFKGAD